MLLAETPDDAISHPRAPHVGGPYGLPAMPTPGVGAGGDDSATPLPQQQPPIPYATPPSLGASPLVTPASGRHGTHGGPEPTGLGRMPSLSGVQAGVPQPRGREISMSAWAAPGAAAAAAAAVAGGGMAAGGGGGTQAGLYRGEASFRTYSNTGDGLSTAASGIDSAASGGGHHRGGGGGTGGGARRTGGSRGHSRHASYDSADVASGREGGGVAGGVDGPLHQRSGSIFELVPPGAYLGGGGGSGTHTPPRLTSAAMASPPRGGVGAGHVPPAVAEAALANVALKQQNDLLLQQVEALRQQVALLAQAAGMGVAAAAAGGAAQAAALGYPPPLPPAPPSMALPVGAATASPVAAMPMSVALPGGGAAGGNLVVSGESAGISAGSGIPVFPGPGSAGSNGNPLGAPMLPPPPMHLHHALSNALVGAAAAAAASAGAVMGGAAGGGGGGVMPYAPPPTPQPPTPPHGVGLPPLSPSGGAGRASAGPVLMMGSGAAGGPPPASMTAAANAAAARHRRSTSVDVSSLIATRDGIGPARDYLPSASQQTAGGAPPSPGGGGGGGMPMLLGASSLRELSLGHATAPPALEALRMNHPGMSLAQAVGAGQCRGATVRGCGAGLAGFVLGAHGFDLAMRCLILQPSMWACLAATPLPATTGAGGGG